MPKGGEDLFDDGWNDAAERRETELARREGRVTEPAAPRNGSAISFDGFRVALLAMIVVVIAIFLAAAGRNIWVGYHSALHDTENQAQNLVQALDEHVARAVGEADRVLLTVANFVGSSRGAIDRGGLAQLLESSATTLPQVKYVEIYDRSGKRSATTAQRPVDEADMPLRGHFVAHEGTTRTGLIISPPYPSPAGDGSWVVYLSRRLTLPGGEFAGMAVVAFDPDYFNQFFKSLNVGTMGMAAILHSDGKLIFRSPAIAGAVGSDVTERSLFAEHLPVSSIGSFRSVMTDGVDRIQAYRRQAEYPLVVQVGLSVQQRLIEWRDSTVQHITLVVLAVLLSALLFHLLVKYLGQVEVAEARFRAAVDGSLDAFFILRTIRDEDGDIADFEFLDINIRAERLLMKVRDNIIGQRLFQLFPPEQTDQLFEQCKRVISTGRPHEDEFSILAPGQRHLWLHSQVVPLADGIAVSLRDITRNKRTEDALRLSQARLTKAQSIGRMGSWEWDIASGLLHWSDEVFRIFNEDPQSFQPTYEDFLARIHPEDRPAIRAAMGEALANHGACDIDHRILLADGSVRIVHQVGEVAFDSHGVPVRMMGVVQDVTQAKQAAEALRESENRFRKLVELSPDAILVHNGERIVFANAMAEKVFRAAADRPLLGCPILDIVHPNDRPATIRRIFDHVQDATPLEGRYLRLTGEIFDAEILATNITLRGESARHVVFRETSERKEMQSQLMQSAKLATLGEMAAGMAHELSQPLNIIRMAADGALMQISHGRASQAYQSDQFTLISDQTTRMAEIIDHIRIFSRKDSAAVEVFDATLAVKRAVTLIEQQVRAENVDLHLSLQSALCPVKGRPVQLEQVLINLMTNALDSLRERSRQVGLKPGWRGWITVAVENEESHVRITVRDNGTGIPRDILDRIFEPFFTTKEVGRGTGLGLSVSFGIISSMGGQLRARNEEEGACFAMSLPHAEAAPMPAPCRPAQREIDRTPIVSEGRHLMVVEDEAEALQTMAGYLEQMGYRVSTATNGTDAFALFMKDPADVVVTDIRMPHGDGEELIERLRDYDPLLPIIIVTGHIGVTDQLIAEDDDRTILMKKPIGLRDLGKTIEELLVLPV